MRDGALNIVATKRWLFTAGASLLFSGLLALLLAIARTPFFDGLIQDPLIFRRALVVHVILALVVWVHASLAALFHSIPSSGGASWPSRLANPIAVVGLVLLVFSGGIAGAEPVLSNYIPVIDHPFFFWGLALFAFGLFLAVWNERLFPGKEELRGWIQIPASARVALRNAALALIAAILCVASAWLALPSGIGAEARYEMLFWGGGHILQVASVLGMSAVWLMLLASLLKRDILPRRAASYLFGVLLAPALLSPLLTLEGAASLTYRRGFTLLMQWGIFPVVSGLILWVGLVLWRERREGALSGKDWRLLALLTSIGLTILGFVLGALIRGSNTMVPAHYHAAIGAVTVALMASFYQLLPQLGIPLRQGFIVRWQPLAFGVGQSVFALGFAIAGHFGMGRKVYGSEQLGRGLAETIGLSIMGAGGLLAAAAGLAFLAIVSLAWLRSLSLSPLQRSEAWIRKTGHTPSRN